MFPTEIWIKIFKILGEDARMSLLLVNHEFCDICLNYVFPPWKDPEQSFVDLGVYEEYNFIDRACRDNNIKYFMKWKGVAGDRWNPVKIRKNKQLYSPALSQACANKNYEIVKEIIKDCRVTGPVVSDVIVECIDRNQTYAIKILLTVKNLDKAKILKQFTQWGSNLALLKIVYEHFHPEAIALDFDTDELKELVGKLSDKYGNMNMIDVDSITNKFNQEQEDD